jgi:hypothetical protein
MVHIKLFENFQGSMEKVYATCFQGDACVGIGILDEDQQRVLQDALDRLISEHPDFTEVRIEKVDVTEWVMCYTMRMVNLLHCRE